MLLILGLAVLVLLLSGAWRKLTLWLAVAAAAVAAFALWRYGLRWEMAPAYLLTAVQLALAALRRVRPPAGSRSSQPSSEGR